MLQFLVGVAVLALIALALIGVVAFSISAMKQSNRRGTTSSLSAAALEVQSILEPGKQSAIEVMHADEEREDEDDVG